MKLYMKNVGHGLNVLINETVMLDCGGNQQLFKQNQYLNYNLVNTFMLSHFHYDHYGRIEDIPTSDLNLQTFYFAGIPLINGTKDYVIDFYVTYLMLQSIQAINTNSNNIFTTVLKKLIPSSMSSTLQCKELFQGDSYTEKDYTYEIIWPPKDISYVPHLVTRINSLNTYAMRYLIEPEQNIINYRDSLKKLMIALINSKITNKDILSFEDETQKTLLIFTQAHSKFTLSDVDTLIRSYKKLANRLSLAFIIKDSVNDKLLSLGDLEKKEIEIVIHCLKNRLDYNILIPPHHGTHWSKEMNHLQIQTTISSLSQSDITKKHYKQSDLANISQIIKDTNTYKDIIETI